MVKICLTSYIYTEPCLLSVTSKHNPFPSSAHLFFQYYLQIFSSNTFFTLFHQTHKRTSDKMKFIILQIIILFLGAANLASAAAVPDEVSVASSCWVSPPISLP